jgi:hypothetical protein
LSSGRVKGYEAHHINTVNGNIIDYARDPNNIRFVSKVEHIQIHREAGGFRSVISNRPLINRALGLFDGVSVITGIISGRIRADTFENLVSDLFGYESPQDTFKREQVFCARIGHEYKGVPCV